MKQICKAVAEIYRPERKVLTEVQTPRRTDKPMPMYCIFVPRAHSAIGEKNAVFRPGTAIGPQQTCGTVVVPVLHLYHVTSHSHDGTKSDRLSADQSVITCVSDLNKPGTTIGPQQTCGTVVVPVLHLYHVTSHSHDGTKSDRLSADQSVVTCLRRE